MKDKCVEFYDDYVVVRPMEVNKKLNGKLNDDTINHNSNIVMKDIYMNDICRRLCNRCSNVECNSSKNGLKTLPTGNINSNIMFINSQPTKYEVASGVPMSDDAGIFLTSLLTSIDINRSDIYITDYIKCLCTNIDEQSYFNCLNTYIKKEIELIHPKIIITNGLALLKTLKAKGVISGLPDDLSYDNIYTVNGDVKITAIYNLSRVLESKNFEDNKNKIITQLLSILTPNNIFHHEEVTAA